MKRKITALIAASALTVISASAALAQTNLPTLILVTPQEGQTIYGNKVPILIAAENFQIVDYKTYPTNQKGQGHVHIWMDDNKAAKDSAAMVTTDTFTYSDVAFGEHTLKAELVNNNHSSLTPPQTTTVMFKTAPVATPSPAAVSGFDKNTALVILVVVALVIVAAWWYTKEEEEQPTIKTTKKSPRSKKRKK